VRPRVQIPGPRPIFELKPLDWTTLFPVVLGTGKRLFADGALPTGWRLLKSQVTPSGVVVASYARDGEVKTGSFAEPEER